MQLSTEDKQDISVFLFNAGHANVRFLTNHVLYRDQTKGETAIDKLIDPQLILKHVQGLTLDAQDKLFVKLVMRQLDPTMQVWSRWGDWDYLPDQVYEMAHWTNRPTKLLELLEDDVFEDRYRIRGWSEGS